MKKVLILNLEGPALDWVITKCKFPDNFDSVWRNFNGDCQYSSDAKEGMQIIDEERLEFRQARSGMLACYPGGLTWFGKTHLEAGMRCYAARVQGNDVEIPDDLAAPSIDSHLLEITTGIDKETRRQLDDELTFARQGKFSPSYLLTVRDDKLSRFFESHQVIQTDHLAALLASWEQRPLAVRGSGKRIVATFVPQVWQSSARSSRAHAVEVEGTFDVDVTRTILDLDFDEILQLKDDRESTDRLVRHSHSGPFYVSVEVSISDYFEVEDIAEITLEMVEAKRREIDEDRSDQPSSPLITTAPAGIHAEVRSLLMQNSKLTSLNAKVRSSRTNAKALEVGNAGVGAQCDLCIVSVTWIPDTLTGNGKGTFVAMGNDGTTVIDIEFKSPGQLAHYVGQDVAEQLLIAPPQDNGGVTYYQVEGLNLRHDGEVWCDPATDASESAFSAPTP